MILTAMVGEALASDTTFFRFCTPLANTLSLTGTTWVAPAYHRTCFRCCETIQTHSCSVFVVPASMCNTGSFFHEIHVSSSLTGGRRWEVMSRPRRRRRRRRRSRTRNVILYCFSSCARMCTLGASVGSDPLLGGNREKYGAPNIAILC